MNGFPCLIVRNLIVLSAVQSVLVSGSLAHAQSRTPKTPAAVDGSSKPKTTIVEMKLLASGDGGGLHSQQWGKVLEPLEVSVQIQRGAADDKPDIRERNVGTIRYVTAIGRLDRSGRISFPGRSFELSDSAKLKEWVDELKTYGAQGTPEGQANWGLSKEQFARVYDSLLKPVEAEVKDLPLAEAIAKLPLPAQFPVKLSQSARDHLAKAGAKNRVRQDVRGFTAATALAVMLNDCQLGFRPNRTPAGGIELQVEPFTERKDLWAVGWPVQGQRFKVAPKLFAMTPIELDQVPLTDLLSTVTELTETPILIDYYEIEKANIDLSKVEVSFKRANTSWSVALKTMVVPRKLSREIWQDEAGRPFVWITTNRPGRSNE